MSGILPTTSSSAGDHLEINDNVFAEFLKEIMLPNQPGPFEGSFHQYGNETPSGGFRDLFSYGLESNLQLNNQDYDIMDFFQGKSTMSYPAQGSSQQAPLAPEPPTPQSDSARQPSNESVALGTEAFRRSLWCWTPAWQDTGAVEQSNFTLSSEEMSNSGAQFVNSEQVASKVFGSDSRDRVVAMILGTCNRDTFPKVMSSFPSAELLNTLMQCFLAAHLAQTDTWIHLPTLRISKARPELLASFLAAGAMFSTSLTIRKLGFAIQEAVRQSIPKVVR